MLNLKRNEMEAGSGEPARAVLTEMKGAASRDRDEILQELLEVKRKLQDCEQNHSNFVSRAVHDVCVPLTAVQGFCGLLLSGQLGTLNADQTEVLEKMRRGLGKLWKSAEAIEGLDQPAQLSTRLKVGDISFEDCLQQALHQLHPVLVEKQISIKLDIEPPTGRLSLDSQRIEQLLVNLLENSIKHSARGGSISICAGPVPSGETSSASPAAYSVDIADSGSAMCASELHQMFDEHASLSEPTLRAGQGLGLAICRMIAEAHQGTIRAVSHGPGTTFSLLLPAPEATKVEELHLSRMAV
jgi:signal transduction histidine kinase